jgi:hypothetical protein
VAAGVQVAMPAQHCVRADQQPYVLQRRPGQRVEQGGEPGPVGRFESDPLPTELALQHRKLMPQGQDLGVLVTVAAWQQP